MTIPHSATGCIATLALSSLTFAQDVLDVNSATGPYFEIRTAVAAANSGDIIRVEDGAYGWFGVFDKSLTIVAAPGAQPVIEGGVRIQNLGADDRVVFSGLRMGGAVGHNTQTLIVNSCTGSVRIEDCEVKGVSWGAVRVEDSDDVTLYGSRLVASEGFPDFGEEGLEIRRSSVTLWDSTVQGGYSYLRAADGADGIWSEDSDLFLHGSSVGGGGGGPDEFDAFSGYCIPAGSGGAGVRSTGSGLLRTLDSETVGGKGGPGFECFAFGFPGEGVVTTTPHIEYDGAALRLDFAPLTTEMDLLDVSIEGQAGDTVLLVIGPDTARVSLPAFVGDLHVGGPVGGARRVLLGSGPAVTAQLQLPSLGAFEAAQSYLQTVHLRPGQTVFGPTRLLTVLDSAW